MYWPNLRHLALTGAMTKPKDFCSFLRKHPTLRSLKLTRHAFGTEAAEGWHMLFQAVHESCYLDEIHLSNQCQDCNDQTCPELSITRRRGEGLIGPGEEEWEKLRKWILTEELGDYLFREGPWPDELEDGWLMGGSESSN